MNKTVVFDLDGTLYFGEMPAPEALQAVHALKNQGYRLLYLTNNSTKTRTQIREKLDAMGFPIEKDNVVYTSAYATAVYAGNRGINQVILIGSEGLREELRNRGITCTTDPEKAEAVVIGLDLSFEYAILEAALTAIATRDLPIIACNRDRNFPADRGSIKPGANAMVSALLGSLPTEKDLEVIGKPSPYLLEMIAAEHHLDKRSLCIVGDSEESDIAMANTYGCPWILVGRDGLLEKDIIKIKGVLGECT